MPHTPGPWTLGQPGFPEPGYVFVGAPKPPPYELVGTLTAMIRLTSPNAMDNAQLIAAAPDLLAACLRLLEESPYQCDEDCCDCGEFGSGFDADHKPCEHIQASRAVAKAEGRGA